ncbi:PstS family phosphate ABC transporter substrate-binding protein [Halorubrum distributum]|uniref:Phosphate binding protein n=3 Tax=Halorubrum distributum TaxID=29283 RepID=M0PMZ3_9EURY|nr:MULTISPECIES: PstS family phosphate ABC transporter substrate-binding protein [Halorubrum distributum group]ELZ34359.1 phosphate binding protein [Halorubrum terrestre JCM 10247]EMA71303.1 phosphate binding protein [Halorubrum arcis JCM 13916]MYL16595.1 phosphate ABC transporter substrate-binding protein PstS family protein [Halorubrum terrestre]MYL66144.1 phosphate ABC transporter substrate-binding protein PstS family protein [Halorubrum terrestre]
MASSHDADTAGITRRKSLAAIAGAGALGLAGCTQSSNGGDGSDGGDGSGGGNELSGPINIAGSSTVFPLMSAVMEDFAEEYPGVDPDISSTGSGGGFSNFFCTGDTDFNNASRPIQPEEEELCADNGVEYVELIAATDALTVVVNPDADFVDSLTTDELAQIWKSDPAQTWDEVRDEFPNEEINRFGAADTSGTYDYFIEAILEEEGHTSDYQATEQDNTIAQGVAGDPYAIGYFGFAYYFQNPDQLKALGIDDGDGPVKPSLETASSGEYTPLSRPLFTYPSIESLGEEHIAEFARYFVEQTTNEDLVAGDVGYVPATEETQEEQMQKLEDAIEQAQG